MFAFKFKYKLEVRLVLPSPEESLCFSSNVSVKFSFQKSSVKDRDFTLKIASSSQVILTSINI